MHRKTEKASPKSPAIMHCVTHGANPFGVNMQIGELGCALAFGPTRAGKSIKLGIMEAQAPRRSRIKKNQ